MERKSELKRKIQWAREDVQFYSDCLSQYKDIFRKHCSKHGDKPDCSCPICSELSSLISVTTENVNNYKQSIREVLRG